MIVDLELGVVDEVRELIGSEGSLADWTLTWNISLVVVPWDVDSTVTICVGAEVGISRLVLEFDVEVCVADWACECD